MLIELIISKEEKKKSKFPFFLKYSFLSFFKFFSCFCSYFDGIGEKWTSNCIISLVFLRTKKKNMFLLFLRLTCWSNIWKRIKEQSKKKKEDHCRTNNKLNFAIQLVLFAAAISFVRIVHQNDWNANKHHRNTENKQFIFKAYILFQGCRYYLFCLFMFYHLLNWEIYQLCNKASSRIFCLFDV